MVGWIKDEIEGIRWSKEVVKTKWKQLQGGLFWFRDSPDKFLLYVRDKLNPGSYKNDPRTIEYIDEAYNEIERRIRRGEWSL